MYLFYENISHYNNNDYLSFYKNINQIKQNKIDKLLRANDKKLSILGELILKEGIKKIYNLDYNLLEFKFNSYGKPYIANSDINYNMSHSHEYSVCALSKNTIGVDIEHIRKVDLNIAKQFCNDRELDYIYQSDKDREKRFFEIYTLKEAYFKMLGTNLNNLKSIEFKISKNKIEANRSNLNLMLIYEIKDYIIAICEDLS